MSRHRQPRAVRTTSAAALATATVLLLPGQLLLELGKLTLELRLLRVFVLIFRLVGLRHVLSYGRLVLVVVLEVGSLQ